MRLEMELSGKRKRGRSKRKLMGVSRENMQVVDVKSRTQRTKRDKN